MRASSTLSLRLRTPEPCGAAAGRFKALFRRRSPSDPTHPMHTMEATPHQTEGETTYLAPPTILTHSPPKATLPPSPESRHRRAVSWSTTIPAHPATGSLPKDSVRSTRSAPNPTGTTAPIPTSTTAPEPRTTTPAPTPSRPAYAALRDRLAGFLPLLSALASSHRRLLSATGSAATAHDGLFAALEDGIHASDTERRCLALEVAELRRELELERGVNQALRERMDVLEMGVAGAVYNAAADIGWLVNVVEGGVCEAVVGEARRVKEEWEARAVGWIDERDAGVWDDEDF